MSFEVKQCRQCKKLFQSYGAAVCPECLDKMDNDYRLVKEYLYDNPESNVVEIVKETGVSEKTVLGFLREGRLSIISDDGFLVCMECGKPIYSGKYCESCMKRLESALNRVSQPIPPEKEIGFNSGIGGGMHLDFNKRKF